MATKYRVFYLDDGAGTGATYDTWGEVTDVLEKKFDGLCRLEPRRWWWLILSHQDAPIGAVVEVDGGHR